MATRISPPQNKTYYINPAYLTFNENSGYGANLIQVSASSSCYISVYDPSNGIGYSDADRNYQRWKVTAYNNKFPDDKAYYIYVRLERNGNSALIVYSKTIYAVDGSSPEDESLPVSESYYYIKIGEVSEPGSSGLREIAYDTGYLTSDEAFNDKNGESEIWELDKLSTPWLIRAKQWLSSFTVKGFVSLVGGLIFKRSGEEKLVSDIKRSVDSDEEVPLSDESLATSKYMADYVENEIEKLDDRFLSKVKDDATPHNLGVGKSLSVGEDISVGGDVVSGNFAEGVRKAGYAARANDNGEYEVEADRIIARILSKTYDLLVENHARIVGDMTSEEFVSGFLTGKGWGIRMKEVVNAAGVSEKKSVAEFDDLIVRGSMRIYEFIVSQMLGENDNRIFTGMMEVDHYDASDGRVYLRTDGGRLYNPFRADDIIVVQQYGGNPTQGNGYYVTKQYEFIVTETGIGEQGDERLDWVTFRNFTTSMEDGDESLIAERDTLVRIDNLSDANRKGVIQLMSVGEDTPYMDFIYGAKTDSDNSLKGRLGNLGGVYNPLFGWLKEFGAYLTNLYAVGEFVIAHTGEDVSDTISITKGQFRTNYRQITYDMSEEQNFFTNASMTNGCEHWIVTEDATSYFLVEELPEFFNYELYGSGDSFCGLAEWKGRDMLRLSGSDIRQLNSLIRQPGTHKRYKGPVQNEDGTFTDVYEEEADTLYLSVRLYVAVSGKVELGFVDTGGKFVGNDFHFSEELTAREDGYEVKLSGTWDGKGDFCIASAGDVYIDLLSLTDKPLDNFKIETWSAIEQTAEKIRLSAGRIKANEGTLASLETRYDSIVGQVSGLQDDLGVTQEELEEFEKAAENSFDGLSKDLLAVGNWQSEMTGAGLSTTMIKQTSDTVNIVSGTFEKDANGNYKLKSAAGSLIYTDTMTAVNLQFATLDGKYAKISTSVQYDPSSGKVTSKIKLEADQIDMTANDYISIINKGTTTISASRVDLNGLVTVSSLNSALNGYATNSELSEAQAVLNQSINSLNTALTSQINAKASTESLNQKVSELNTAIGGKADTSGLKKLAYEDVVEAALCGSTLISNGYLNTDYIKVKKIVATEGTIATFNITEDSIYTIKTMTDPNTGTSITQRMDLSVDGVTTVSTGGIVCSTKYGLSRTSISGGGWYSSITIFRPDNDTSSLSMCGIEMEVRDKDRGLHVQGGSSYILSDGCTQIYGLTLKTRVMYEGGSITKNDDVVLFGNSGTITVRFDSDIPDGKVVFLKRVSSGAVNLTGRLRYEYTYQASNQTRGLDEDSWMAIKTDSTWTLWYCG